MVDAGSEKAGNRHDEDNRATHAKGCLRRLGDAQEGSDAKYLRQDKVVDKNTANYETDIRRHGKRACPEG